MSGERISALTVEGYTSIRAQTVRLRDLNVLVGPNGGGKSNLISALEMLGRLVEEELSLFVGLRGGASSLLFAGPGRSARIRLALDFPPSAYEAKLRPAAGDAFIFERELISYQGDGYDEPWSRPRRGGGRETELHVWRDEQAQGSGVAGLVIDALRGCRVFHFHDTSSSAPVKQFVGTADNLRLRNDAGNLPAYLLRLRDNDPDRYDTILRVIQLVAPFFRSFILEPEGPERIRLRWLARDSDRVFGAESLSDGTLRFMCLATLFLGPDLPRLAVLDEPELGLHPYAINQLAGLIRQAKARGSQVVLATQSVTLMNQFSLEDLVVVERQDGESVFSRPDPDELSRWLDEYSLGELWEKNLLGGRPSREGGATGQ